MFQGPIAESKPHYATTRVRKSSDPEREMHSRLLGDGSYTHSASRTVHATSAYYLELQRSVGNQAVLHLLLRSGSALQTKLTVNEPGDRFEQEADLVADQVMRIPDPHAARLMPASPAVPTLQRQCSCGGTMPSGGTYAECAEKEKLQRSSNYGSPLPEAPAIVNQAIRAQGHPLDDDTRTFMEHRFGYSFSRIRIHVDGVAAQSAAAVNALAYTVGEQLVFAAGQYSPGSTSGRRLIAHELAHVVQQSAARPVSHSASRRESGSALRHEAHIAPHGAEPITSRINPAPVGQIQRTCGRALGKPTKDCTPSDTGIIGLQFLFKVNCDELQSFEFAHLAEIVKTIPKDAPLNVHGYASIEGESDFNRELSCHRANKLTTLILAARPDCNIYETFKHGAQSGPPGVDFWRAASVEIAHSNLPPSDEPPKPEKPTPPNPIPSCPDIPTSTPSTCAGRHAGYAAAARCFPLNAWLPCVARTSQNICRVVEAFNLRGDEGGRLSLCVSASYGGNKDLVRAKGAWFDKTNACIWGHWRAALEAMHDPTKAIPSGVTPEWAEAIKICRKEGIGSSGCCMAHVFAEQWAIEHCGGYDALQFGKLPTDVPSAPLCSDFVMLASGPLPFTKDFENVADRIDYGDFICCGM